MPELPEVETIRLDLQKYILGQTIQKVNILDARVVRNLSPEKFCRCLKGRKFCAINRRGKAIICVLDDQKYLVVQPMMTGQLVYVPKGQHTIIRETRVVFALSNGTHLNYNDQRLFGRLCVVKNLNEIDYFQTIGPEPLTDAFTLDWISRHLPKRKMAIKTVLLDHKFVAGIGNIYASEILFGSCIHPQRSALSLTGREIVRLKKNTQTVLLEAIRFRGTSMRNYRDADGQEGLFKNRIKVYGREHEPCVRCSTPIRKIVLNARSTFFCAQCQH